MTAEVHAFNCNCAERHICLHAYPSDWNDAQFALTVVEQQAFTTLGIKRRDIWRAEKVIGELVARRCPTPSVNSGGDA